MIGPVPVCMECKHLRETEGWGFYCDAFPEDVPNPQQIPDKIFVGGDPHTEAVEGDHGIRFEAK